MIFISNEQLDAESPAEKKRLLSIAHTIITWNKLPGILVDPGAMPPEEMNKWEFKPPPPIPFAEWPNWAKRVFEEREVPEEKGVGDTVHRRLGDGGLAFRAWTTLLKIPCGCDLRRDLWNAVYPYENREAAKL